MRSIILPEIPVKSRLRADVDNVDKRVQKAGGQIMETVKPKIPAEKGRLE